jgi:hypothetical protein
MISADKHAKKGGPEVFAVKKLIGRKEVLYNIMQRN